MEKIDKNEMYKVDVSERSAPAVITIPRNESLQNQMVSTDREFIKARLAFMLGYSRQESAR